MNPYEKSRIIALLEEIRRFPKVEWEKISYALELIEKEEWILLSQHLTHYLVEVVRQCHLCSLQPGPRSHET